MGATLDNRITRLERDLSPWGACTCGRVVITDQHGQDLTGSPDRCPHGHPWTTTIILPDNGRDRLEP